MLVMEKRQNQGSQRASVVVSQPCERQMISPSVCKTARVLVVAIWIRTRGPAHQIVGTAKGGVLG